VFLVLSLYQASRFIKNLLPSRRLIDFDAAVMNSEVPTVVIRVIPLDRSRVTGC